MVYLISIEGNIGSGKSTLVKNLREHYKDNKFVYFLDEPVSEWIQIKDEDNVDILSLFYGNTKKYAFPFQMMAYISRIHMLRKAIRENPNCIFITERSVYTDKNVFAQMLFDDKMISSIEFQIYNKWFKEFAEVQDVSIIYVNTNAEKCDERIKKRNRKGEVIPLDYLKRCGEYHDMWLKENKYKVLEFDGNDDKDLNSKSAYDDWIKQINTFIVKTFSTGESVNL